MFYILGKVLFMKKGMHVKLLRQMLLGIKMKDYKVL